MAKKMLLVIGLLVLACILYVGGMLLLAEITQFNPPPVEDVALTPAKNGDKPRVLTDSTYTLLTWNLGYGGLGKEVDFFYDGGKMVTSPKAHVEKNNAGMVKVLKENSDADFILLQEVDRKGKRSWNIDQAEEFATALPDHDYAYTLNYDVQYLPFPFLNPIGRVYGGLQTLAKYTPVETKRYALPNITDFPRRLFYLKRCLMLQRYKLANGKDLVVMNAHFEAYDEGGLVKKQQREVTKKILEEEYAKGNYVILGADWNIAPPGFNVHKWEHKKITDQLYLMNNDSVYVPGWSYVYDSTTATNRKNETSYVEGVTFKTIIDYFYVSPNVEVESIKGIDLGFDYSDHNPVKMQVRLK
ncbi:MAG TPA: endonuclease/exonuclease/phosphatase family protein [Chitinophagales bacterium]|nr:endonuclease/exonuclease/phosphatase family protein [Chitinophagales bacterium]